MGASPEGDGVAIIWKQPHEVGWALIDARPDTDPLELDFVDLHRMVVELEGFTDDPDEADETILEALVMAGHDQR
jgi:FeS assembly protein IscX